ncbi:MAG: ABC transporter six-transmembrane domain-containing protein [Bacteroidota bacterium]|nr:ABC transporter six-transmembrane domain-containing protein [Bacteroidota bacterium]
MLLTKLFRKYYRSILFAISLVVIENVAWIIEPTVFGKVIDAFIDKAVGSEGVKLITPLIVWIGVFLTNSGVGALRRAVDPKIYLTMFSHIAVQVAETANERGHSVSKTVARAELSREYINFFQYRFPEIIEQSIAIGGAVIALFFFDWRISLSCLFIVLPLLLTTKLYIKKVMTLQGDLHDTKEEAFDIFSTKDIGKIKTYYQRIAKAEQKIAYWGALNFGFIRTCLLGIFLLVLYISIDIDDFTTGSIYSIVAYLWTFVTSTEYLPELLESSTAIRDISRRLEVDE